MSSNNKHHQNNQQILSIIEKYKLGKATRQEIQLLDQWYDSFSEDELYTERMSIAEKLTSKEKHLQGINKQIYREAVPFKKTKTYRLWPRITAAAAILVVLSAGLLFFNRKNTDGTTLNTFKNDVPAGRNQAFLILANGKKIALADAAKGEIAKEAGMVVSKLADGQVIYTVAGAIGVNHSPKFNTITTPNGGTWQLRLPDGTEVWLNASTTLRYPVSFAGKKERSIELSGEAYFEVFKDKAHPFRVSSRGQQVEVLGTHFNINAYEQERLIKTTLLEGSVKIAPLGYVGGHENLPMQNLAVTLKPGEQSVNDGGHLKVTAVNANYAVTWKEGYFLFDNERLESIMEKLSRWYDVKVIYEDASLKQETIIGTTSRSSDISNVLNMMARAEVVKFRVEGKTVFVQRNK